MRRPSPASARRLARLALAGLAALASPGVASSEGLSLRYAPAYSLVDTQTTLADGTTSESRADSFTQRLALTLDRRLYPTLGIGASGLLDWNQGWSRDGAGRWTDSDLKRWNGTARAEYLLDPLRASLLYGRRDAVSQTVLAGDTTSARGPAQDDYALLLGWRPVDLPTASLSLTRSDTRSSGASPLDRTTQGVALSIGYDGLERWRFSYAYQLLDPIDRIRETETVEQSHSARVSWSDQFAGGRVTTFASYSGAARTAETTSGALGATRETRQLPSAGLSAVERFPDTPDRVTLLPTPALVDSDLAGGAGLDLGFGRSVAGDTAIRDLGVQLPDDRTDVNTLRVYVDRQLPAAVAAALAWEVWRSDDNLTWTRVATLGAAPFASLQNRFELVIPTTRARFLKVVTRPLAAAATTDPLYSAVLVTELEAWLVEALPPGTTRSNGLTGNATGGVRVLFLRDPNVSYDLAFSLGHKNHPTDLRASVDHSLAWAQELGPTARASARVSRSDTFDRGPHQGQTSWGGAVGGEPLPTLGWTANYSGSQATTLTGTSLSNGVATSLRADLYERVAAGLSAAWRLTVTGVGRQSQNATVGATTTVVPHPALTLAGTLGWLYSEAHGGGESDRATRAGRAEGAVTFNPFPALYLSATGARNLFGLAPAVQTGLTAGLSLFHGGGLSLRFNYNRTSDTISETRSSTLGAGLVWTLAVGKSLSLNVSRLDSTSPAETVRSDAITAQLQLPAF